MLTADLAALTFMKYHALVTGYYRRWVSLKEIGSLKLFFPQNPLVKE